jgi:chemotaxis protein CheD
MTLTAQSVVIGMGELQIAKDDATVLTCLGLGSCVALCAYDSKAKVAGMAHIVLPSGGSDAGGTSVKYADSGVPLLINKMMTMGARKSSLTLKIAGGSRMLSIPGAGSARMNIGERNAEEVKNTIRKLGLRIEADDTGGTTGRTVQLFADSGRVTVKKVGGEATEL